MITEDLSELRLVKNQPCVSIIVPMHGKQPVKDGDQSTVANAFNKAVKLMQNKLDKENAGNFLEKLKKVASELDIDRCTEGLGVFLSQNLSKVVKFTFPVEEKVIVSNEFETRDLVYSTKNLFNYYYLALSRKVTRLYKGYGEMLSEITDENYPRSFTIDNEYEKIHHGPNKSIVEEHHARTFFKNIDYLLFLYVNKDTPLFVGGTNDDIAIFSHVTVNSKYITGFIDGSPDKRSEADLRMMLRPELRKYVDAEKEAFLQGFQDLMGTGRVVWGISKIWKYAAENKIHTLLIEKDYACKARVSEDGKALVAEKNSNNDGSHVTEDVVNDLIEMVIDKGGDVLFVENGKLAKFERAACILSFKD